MNNVHIARIPVGSSRLDTTRYLAHAFRHREKSRRDMSRRRACRTARRDTLVMTSATRTTRVQWRRHSVDWSGHVHLTFSRSCSWDWCKSRAQKTKRVHTSTILLLRRPPCWNKHGSTRSSWSTRQLDTSRTYRVVLRHDEPIWAYQHSHYSYAEEKSSCQKELMSVTVEVAF